MFIPNNYHKYDCLLGNRPSRKLDNHTYCKRRENYIAILLHSTDIIKYYPDGTVIVHTGGWRTITTKDRINKYSPLEIYQANKIWYIKGEVDSLFYDGIVLRDGIVQSLKLPTSEDKKLDKVVRKTIRTIVSEVVDNLPYYDCYDDCRIENFFSPKEFLVKKIASVQLGNKIALTKNDCTYLVQMAIKRVPISQYAKYVLYGSVPIKDSFCNVGLEQIKKSVSRYLFELADYAI